MSINKLSENQIYRLSTPLSASSFILNIPHSGRLYPADFRTNCPPDLLRAAEDNEVDMLFEGCGATVLAAQFPRTYIDVNRAVTDIDAALLDGLWPGRAQPTARSRAGMGLVRRLLRPGVRLYDRRLRPEEVRRRIDEYYLPYHAALETLLNETRTRFGSVWLLDCHSMPARQAADFVLGDGRGQACAPGFIEYATGWLSNHGYRVAINDPYSGVEILRRHGRPKDGRHALQLEINKRLYWDEGRQVRNAGFDELATTMRELAVALNQFAQENLSAQAAE